MAYLKPLLIKLQDRKSRKSLFGNPSDTVNIKAGFVDLGPGESVGEHITEAKEEVVVILKGRAEISCGLKTPLIAEENSVVYIPPQIKHNVKNIGRENLKYIYVVSRVNSSKHQ